MSPKHHRGKQARVGELGMGWDRYPAHGWDEMFDGGRPRPPCAGVFEYLSGLGADLHERQRAADLAIRAMGITFAVSSEAGGIDRSWPFDVS